VNEEQRRLPRKKRKGKCGTRLAPGPGHGHVRSAVYERKELPRKGPVVKPPLQNRQVRSGTEVFCATDPNNNKKRWLPRSAAMRSPRSAVMRLLTCAWTWTWAFRKCGFQLVMLMRKGAFRHRREGGPRHRRGGRPPTPEGRRFPTSKDRRSPRHE
jgi:hypothetical protein